MIALLLLILLPAVGGTGLLLLGRRADRAAPVASLLVAGIVLVTAVAASVTRPELSVPFISTDGGDLAVDGLTAVLLPMVAAVTLLVLVFAVAQRTRPAARFHGLMLVFAAAVMVTLTATSFPALLAAWEIMGATSYALIGVHWWEPTRMQSGFVAFVVTRTADLGLYLAAGAAIAAGAGWALADLRDAPAPWVHVIAAGVLVAGLGKAAQLPFSFWLSRAMVGPSPVSALLHSAAMVAMGGYLLLRMGPLLELTGWAASVTAWVGATTAIVLGIVAVAQRDIKQLLAASTAAQLGFVVLAAGIGATAGGAAQLVAHAATKALLFLVAGAWLTALGSRRLDALRGVGRRWRSVGVVFGIGALALAGIPPLSLWATKDAVLAAALAQSPLLYAAGLGGAALSAAYAAKMIAIVFANPRPAERTAIESGWDTEQPGTRRIGAATIAPMIVLAAASALLGITALPPVGASFRTTVGDATGAEGTPLELIASAAIAVVLVALVLLRGPVRLPAALDRFALGWLGLERAAAAAVTGPTLALAGSLARFDSRLDAVVDGSTRVLDRSAAGSALLDRAVDAGVSGVSAAAAGLGRTARRLQSGSIADYYTGAAVITVVAIVLVIAVR